MLYGIRGNLFIMPLLCSSALLVPWGSSVYISVFGELAFILRQFFKGKAILKYTLCYLRLHYCLRMDSQKSYRVYDGKTDVRKFVTRVDLEGSLKDYNAEKKAQYIASKLVGPAMDVYLRLTDDEKKDPEKLKAELLKEFERGQLNREEAISELDSRKRLTGESAETFAFKVVELVKLAYPTFQDNVRQSLAKDYFVRGLSNELQLALKSTKEYPTMTVKEAATEAVRLELAGVGEKKPVAGAINSCDEMVNAIAEKVLMKLGDLRVTTDADNGGDTAINNATYSPRRGNYRGRGRDRGRGRGRTTYEQNRPQRKCRSCQSSDHLIKDCPTRFCQACGGRGHDQYNSSCPNFSA